MSVSWLFEVNGNYWSTDTITYDGHDYLPKIISDSFDGVTMRCNLDGYLLAPNNVEFEISNPSNTLARADVEGYDCTITKLVDDVLSRAWKFKINRAVPYEYKLKCYCVDFLQEFLTGQWPKTLHPKEIWPSDDFDPDILDDFCVPVVLGTAYIPIMSANTGADRYYILGDNTTPTYTVTEVTSPHDWPGSSVYGSGDYAFNQSDDDGYKLVQLIVQDSDGDDVVDANGLWPGGDGWLPPLIKFSRDDTVGLTSPEEWFEYILEDFGVDSGDIDTGVGSSFAAAGVIYAARSQTWNGGFWKKENRESLIVSLLKQCDSMLVVTDKIELHPFDKTSIETITGADVKNLTYSPSPLTQSTNDGGRVCWPDSGKPQDKFPGKSVVPLYTAQASITNPVGNTLIYRFDPISQNAQDAAVLHFQKRLLQKDRMRFETECSKITNINTLLPGQVLTLNDSIFGASFALIITELGFKPDNSLSVEGIRLEYLEDWGDMDASEVVITGDSSSGWQVAVVGASGVLAEDVNWSAVQDDDDHKPEDDSDVTSHHAGQCIDNPNFEAGDVGWEHQIGTGWSIATGNEYLGTYCAEHDGAEGDAYLANNNKFPVGVGERYLLQGYVNADADADGNALFGIYFYTNADVYVDAIYGYTAACDSWPNAWTFKRAIITVPATAAYGRVRLRRFGDPTTGNIYIDNLACVQLLKDGDLEIYITVGPTAGESNYTSIADAIAAVTVDNARIYIRNGTYEVDSAMTLPAFDIEIIGESKGGVIIQSPTADFIFERPTTIAKTYKFKNLTFTSRTSANGYHMIYMDAGAYDLTIEDCIFNLYDSSATVGDSGVYIVGDNSASIVRILRCTFNGGKWGARIEDIDICNISACKFDGQSDISVRPIDIGNLMISENTFVNLGLFAMWISETTHGISAIISNNQISTSDSLDAQIVGIYIDGYDRLNVIGNIILFNRTGSITTGQLGIIAYQTEIQTSIVGNTIQISSDTDLNIYSIRIYDTSNFIVSDNIIKTDAPSAEGEINGVYVGGDSSNGIVANNNINLINNTAIEVGIYIGFNADNNYGDGNLTSNVGTSIDDNGTGNNITAQDV